MFFQTWKAPETPAEPATAPSLSETPYEYKVPVPEGSEADKRAFAEALLRQPDNPMEAAIKVFGALRGSHCFHVSVAWPQQDDVKRYMREALEEQGPAAFVPDKYEIAREVVGIARNRYTMSDVALKAYKLYAEILDFNPKVSDNSKQVNVGVMLVNHHGNDDEWENDLRAQQAKLIIDASSK